MKLEPIVTEKSMNEAKEGRYTFLVDRNLNKHKIKRLIEDVFGVNVLSVHTLKVSGEEKRTFQGRYRIIKPQKKAIVTLREKEKIDLFEEGKK